MNTILQDIADYMQEKEFLAVFLMTILLLVVAFIAHTRFDLTMIVSQGTSRVVHISYYGFPREMAGILTPVGQEADWVALSNSGSLRVLWDGLAIDFALYFALSFFVVYLLTRARAHFASRRVE